MIQKYGKSLVDMLSIKSNFIPENADYMAHEQKVSAMYRKQPKRASCKLCGFELPDELLFESHGIGYKTCVQCTHLNGEYEDTLDFAEWVYVNEDYGALDYYENDKSRYLKRMHAIYEPKAKFLIDCLNTLYEDTYSMKYLDYGAGSGYFVYACKQLGLSAFGVDLSKNQVDFANELIGEPALSTISHDASLEYITNTKADVISFISVLEHINDLHRTLEAIVKNPQIKYVYFNAPLFSLTCILEAMNQDYWNRQLGADHTHLYTKKSLDWLYNRYGFEPVAVWDFGTEMMDFMRFMILDLYKQGASEQLVRQMQQYFIEHGDDIQLAVDRSGFASETHVLMRKKQGCI